MSKKSERTSSDRQVSATHASRQFSWLLDEVEKGNRFLVERRGRIVCLVSPPPVSGRRASECLKILQDRTGVHLDEEFAKDLLEVLGEEAPEDRPAWES